MVAQSMGRPEVVGYHDYPQVLEHGSDDISSTISTSIWKQRWSELSSALFSDEIRLRVYDFGEREGDDGSKASPIITGG